MKTLMTLTVLALTALLALAGCAQPTPAAEPVPSTSPATAPQPLPFDATVKQLLEVDRANPDKVAKAFATLVTSWDVSTDRTETAATMRAKPLMASELAGRTAEPERNGSQALWLELGPLKAISVPVIGPGVPLDGDERTDTEDIAYRNVTATWSWTDTTGKHLRNDDRKRNIFMILTRHNGAWSVYDYTTEDLPA